MPENATLFIVGDVDEERTVREEPRMHVSTRGLVANFPRRVRPSINRATTTVPSFHGAVSRGFGSLKSNPRPVEKGNSGESGLI